MYGLRRWFALTFVMGLVFVLGQVNEYRTLVHEGVKINQDGYGSMFYLTTGFHGLHVTGGLIAFIFFSHAVAKTVGSGIVSPELLSDRVIFGALMGAISRFRPRRSERAPVPSWPSPQTAG